MKAILQLSNGKYVMPLEDATAIASILARSESYQAKYRSGGSNTHHIYANESETLVEIRVISEDFYNLCKLAGAPE